MKKFLSILILCSISLSTFCQEVRLRDSIDKVANRILKKKMVKYTQLLDDSTGKTFEHSKKSGYLVLACLKSYRGSVATELHFVYSNNYLLRINCTKWDFEKKQATIDYYYFRNNKFISSFPSDFADTNFVDYLLKTSEDLSIEASKLHGRKR